MTWTWALAALTLATGLPPARPASDDPPPKPAAQEARLTPLWQLSIRVAAPMTSTDPNHVAVGLGVARSGAYRVGVNYQPSESKAFGGLRATMGVRLLRRERVDVAFDLDFNQVWADRALFRGTGWQLEGHDERRLSLGAVSMHLRQRPLFGVIEGVELGAGRLYLREMVSARAGGSLLNVEPDSITVFSGPVGMVGVHLARPLFWGLTATGHVRVIGAGRSRGGQLPFAHVTGEWGITRQIFSSRKFGRGEFGLVGNHASSPRAATYFQNGLGLTMRIAF